MSIHGSGSGNSGREKFDNESTDDQKRRMGKLGKLMDEDRKERAEDVNPLDFNKALNEDEKNTFARAIADDISSKFGSRAAWRQPYDVLFDEIYALFHSTQSARKVKTRTRIFIPIVFQVIIAAIPKIINTLFTTDEFFEVDPINPVDEDLGNDIRRLIIAQLRMANFFVKFIDFVEQLLLYGTSYLKVFWKVKRGWVWTRTPIRERVVVGGVELSNDIVEWEERKEYKVIERRPEIEVVDVLDVFPDSEAETVDDEDKGVMIQSWMSLEMFKKMGAGDFPIFANTDMVKAQSDAESRNETRGKRKSSRGTAQSFAEDKQVHLISYWGPYDVDGDGIEEEAHIVVANNFFG